MGNETTINPLLQFLPLILIFGIFYFLVILPQKKQQNEFKAMVDKLQKNDEIVTAGGIHGTIVGVKESTIVIRVDENVKLEIDRTAVARITKKYT